MRAPLADLPGCAQKLFDRHSERSEESLFLLLQNQEGFLASLGMTYE
jgi:hypothetical protein